MAREKGDIECTWKLCNLRASVTSQEWCFHGCAAPSLTPSGLAGLWTRSSREPSLTTESAPSRRKLLNLGLNLYSHPPSARTQRTRASTIARCSGVQSARRLRKRSTLGFIFGTLPRSQRSAVSTFQRSCCSLDPAIIHLRY